MRKDICFYNLGILPIFLISNFLWVSTQYSCNVLGIKNYINVIKQSSAGWFEKKVSIVGEATMFICLIYLKKYYIILTLFLNQQSDDLPTWLLITWM